MNQALLQVKVQRKTVEAADICTYELVDASGAALPHFSAGSHIDVHVSEGTVRQYSLCNSSLEKHRYLIAVLRDPKSRGGSNAMHDIIQEGNLIQISEPKNHFQLAHAARRSLLVAGGIGVTPILCMAERLANVDAPFEMHYCTRSRERTAFVDRIANSNFANKVHFHFDDGPASQKLDVVRLLSDALAGTHLYVCGPTGFMDFVLGEAKRLGWDDERVHREYFSAEVQKSEADESFDVKIASTGKLIRIPHDQTVVDALAAADIEIPVSCAQGVCGTCLTRVIEGEPDHRDMYLTDEERAQNDQFLPCCSRAKSKLLVLDL